MSRNMILVTTALALTVIWLGFLAFVHYVDRPDSPMLVSPDAVVNAVVLVVPIVLVWLAAAIMSYTNVEDELWRLNSEVRSLRAALSHRVKLDGQHENERSEAGGALPGAGGGRNPVSGTVSARPAAAGIPNSIIIRALNFAEDFGDVAGIAAVETAAQQPDIARLLDSSMDVLNGIAKAGVLLDDLDPDLAGPEEWRHANPASPDTDISALGRISAGRDLALMYGYIGREPEFQQVSAEFRDQARRFLGTFVAGADDNEIAAILGSRTLLAFLLLENLDLAKHHFDRRPKLA